MSLGALYTIPFASLIHGLHKNSIRLLIDYGVNKEVQWDFR